MQRALAWHIGGTWGFAVQRGVFSRMVFAMTKSHGSGWLCAASLTALMVAAVAGGCATRREEPQGANDVSGETEASAESSGETTALPEYIGEATMDEDRVITLRLRAEGPGGAVGHGMLTYAPDHPEYEQILEHLGGLEPGEEKPVRPFPDRPESSE